MGIGIQVNNLWSKGVTLHSMGVMFTSDQMGANWDYVFTAIIVTSCGSGDELARMVKYIIIITPTH